MQKIPSPFVLFIYTALLTVSTHAQQPEVVVQTGLRGWEGTTYGPRGNYFATREKNRVKLWDTRTLMELWSYPHNASDLGFVRGGSRLVTCLVSREQNLIRVWNIATGEVELEIPGDGNLSQIIACSGRGRRFAFIQSPPSSSRKQLIVYDTERNQEEKRIKPPKGFRFNRPKSMVMGPDDRLLVMALGSGLIAFDLNTGDSLWTTPAVSKGGILRISPDGKWLVLSGNEERAIYLYEAGTGRLEETLPLEKGFWGSLAFGGARNELLYTRDHKLHVWNLNRLGIDPIPPARQIEHPKLRFSSVLASPDGEQLLVFDDRTFKQYMHVLERESLTILKTITFAEREYGRQKIDDGGAKIYFTQKKQPLRYWDLARGEIVDWPDPKNRFLPWDTPAGRLYFDLNAVATSHATMYDPDEGREHVFENSNGTSSIHPDGRRMVTNNDPYKGEEDRFGIVLWDLERRQQLHELILGNELNCQFAFTPDGKKLAAGDFDIHVLKVGKKELKPWKRLPHPSSGVAGSVEHLRFTGKDRLQAIYNDGRVIDWDVNKETQLNTLELEIKTGSVDRVIFSPDDRLLALFYESSNFAELFDWPSGQPRYDVSGHADEMRDLTFGDDGQRLYTTDRFGMTRISDARTGEPIANLVPFPPDGYLIVLPDNQYLASPGVVKKVGFRYAGRVYPFEQFDLKLTAPTASSKDWDTPNPPSSPPTARHTKSDSAK